MYTVFPRLCSLGYFLCINSVRLKCKTEHRLSTCALLWKSRRSFRNKQVLCDHNSYSHTLTTTDMKNDYCRLAFDIIVLLELEFQMPLYVHLSVSAMTRTTVRLMCVQRARVRLLWPRSAALRESHLASRSKARYARRQWCT